MKQIEKDLRKEQSAESYLPGNSESPDITVTE